MSGGTKKRKDLSLKEKQAILDMYDKLPKMSQRCAANRLNISQPVLCKILKNRSIIENSVLSNENINRKRARSGKDSQVESALKTWFLQKNASISGPLIRQKAEELARTMGRDNFSATNGWFSRWKKRENIAFKLVREEKMLDETGMVSAMADKCENVLGYVSKIKKEPESETEDDYLEPPSDVEMMQALEILRRGVRHRTNNLVKQYEYEDYIQKLLKSKE